MRVRKFEARTMKEAFEMVKRQLGPDAIILSARDRGQGFGIAGAGSIEITAAVTEETLKKKEYAEAKLPAQDKERYLSSPARMQKQFIQKAIQRYEAPPEPEVKKVRRSDAITSMPYISIPDEEGLEMSSTDDLAENARRRIRQAAQRAWKTFLEDEEPAPRPKMRGIEVEEVREVAQVSRPVVASSSNEDINSLRLEIANLRKTIEGFQPAHQPFVQLHPGANDGIPYELSFMYERLERAGVASPLIVEMLTAAQRAIPIGNMKTKPLIDAWVARYIMDQAKISTENSSRLQFFFGPSSQGKTSTLVKMASRYVIQEKKKVAILTTDVFKVGAAEQLKIYAQILNLPYGVIWHPSDWQQYERQLANVDHILVDFPGLSLRNEAETEWIKEICSPTSEAITRHYVQSAVARWEEAEEIAHRYQNLGFQDVIFTHLDETSRHGMLLNFQKQFQVPFHSFGVGSSVPEDFEPATRERIVDLIFKISKVKAREGEIG